MPAPTAMPQPTAMPAPTAMPQPTAMPAADSLTVTLDELNGSGQSGSVTLTDRGDQTEVALTATAGMNWSVCVGPSLLTLTISRSTQLLPPLGALLKNTSTDG